MLFRIEDWDHIRSAAVITHAVDALVLQAGDTPHQGQNSRQEQCSWPLLRRYRLDQRNYWGVIGDSEGSCDYDWAVFDAVGRTVLWTRAPGNQARRGGGASFGCARSLDERASLDRPNPKLVRFGGNRSAGAEPTGKQIHLTSKKQPGLQSSPGPKPWLAWLLKVRITAAR